MISSQELALKIKDKHYDKNKNNYGDKVWFLMEPDGKLQNNVTRWTKKEIGKKYNEIFKCPGKYCIRNVWAGESMLILNQMLMSGMSPNHHDLDMAVDQGFPSIVDKILEFDGINVNGRCYNGRTPLHTCIIRTSNIKILCSLIAAGADFSIQDNDGNTPLYDIVLFNRKWPSWIPDLVIDHLEIYDYNKINKSGLTILWMATYCNLLDVVKKLLDKGCDPSIKSKDCGRSSTDLVISIKDRNKDNADEFINLFQERKII